MNFFLYLFRKFFFFSSLRSVPSGRSLGCSCLWTCPVFMEPTICSGWICVVEWVSSTQGDLLPRLSSAVEVLLLIFGTYCRNCSKYPFVIFIKKPIWLQIVLLYQDISFQQPCIWFEFFSFHVYYKIMFEMYGFKIWKRV